MAKTTASSRMAGTKSGALTADELDASINKLSQGTPFPWSKVHGCLLAAHIGRNYNVVSSHEMPSFFSCS